MSSPKKIHFVPLQSRNLVTIRHSSRFGAILLSVTQPRNIRSRFFAVLCLVTKWWMMKFTTQQLSFNLSKGHATSHLSFRTWTVVGFLSPPFCCIYQATSNISFFHQFFLSRNLYRKLQYSLYPPFFSRNLYCIPQAFSAILFFVIQLLLYPT